MDIMTFITRGVETSIELLSQPATNFTVILLIGIYTALAAWQVVNHFREDRFFPKIEFFCDAFFKIERDDYWLVEVVCVVRNKGIAGHRARNLNFKLHGIRRDEEALDGDESINFQVEFPENFKSGHWKIRKGMNERVEAGTAQFYRHVARISKDYDAIAVHGSMEYKQRRRMFLGERVTHTCNRLVRVPKDSADAQDTLKAERLALTFGETVS
jgi:hypothetical protein